MALSLVTGENHIIPGLKPCYWTSGSTRCSAYSANGRGHLAILVRLKTTTIETLLKLSIFGARVYWKSMNKQNALIAFSFCLFPSEVVVVGCQELLALLLLLLCDSRPVLFQFTGNTFQKSGIDQIL